MKILIGLSLVIAVSIILFHERSNPNLDIERKIKTIQAFYPEFNDRNAAELQIKRTQQLLKILSKNGIELGDSQITNEEQRIDRETQDPKRLEQIKSIFKSWTGFDRSAYRNVFIVPQLAERLAFELVYFSDHAFQSSTRSILQNNPTKRRAANHPPSPLIEEGLIHRTSDQTLEWTKRNQDKASKQIVEPLPFEKKRTVDVWRDAHLTTESFANFSQNINETFIRGNLTVRVGPFFYRCDKPSGNKQRTIFPCVRTPLKSYDLWLEEQFKTLE